jgi:hypothetical protein
MMQNDQFIQKKTKILVRRIATAMRDTAKMLTPIDTARLRNSIRIYDLNGGMGADIRTSVPYAAFVEYGTGIYATNGVGRRTPWVYKHKRFGWVRTRGQRPSLYMTKAFRVRSTDGYLTYIARGVFK